MRKDDNKIQTYVDEKTRAFLTQKAQEKSISTSKYIASVLAEHVENDKQNKIYNARILLILSHILSCVYDENVSQANTEATNKLMAYIKENCIKSFD